MAAAGQVEIHQATLVTCRSELEIAKHAAEVEAVAFSEKVRLYEAEANAKVRAEGGQYLAKEPSRDVDHERNVVELKNALASLQGRLADHQLLTIENTSMRSRIADLEVWVVCMGWCW